MEKQPEQEAERIEETVKIGHTTYIVTGYFASDGATMSDKIKRLLDKEIDKEQM